MPKGHAKKGIRIVNGRSPAQRAHAKRYGATAPVAGDRARQMRPPPPAGSWWVGLPREAFSQMAAAQFPRLESSTFGQVSVFTGE